MEYSNNIDTRSRSKQRVPEADDIGLFKDRLGVRLSFAGAAFLSIYKERLATIELRPGWVTALAIVSEHPGMTQSELGRSLAINRASAMALARRLEESVLIERKSSSGRQPLYLTPIGISKLKEACHIEDQIVNNMLNGLNAHQEEALMDALKLVSSNLRGL